MNIFVNDYLKSIYGEKVYKLALNAGMTCPNRDGSLSHKGCDFCSAQGSGDFATQCNAHNIHEQLQKAKNKINTNHKCNKYIAYFQSFTNTYAPIDKLRELYTAAINEPDVVILSIATRCDCLPDDVLQLLRELNSIKPVWIELGLQSIHTQTLKNMNCCYDYAQFSDAVHRLHEAGITTIAHLILGLPHETHDMMKESVLQVCSLPIDGIKLQLLHVLKGTALEQMYYDDNFHIMDMEEYCTLVTECLHLIPSNIIVHRITGDGPKDLLIEPRWSLDKKRVLNCINKKLNTL